MSNLKLPSIESFADAEKVLGGAHTKRIGYETTLEVVANGVEKVIAVKHFNTYIIEYRANGLIGLNCGGYHSRTTSNRLHKLTPMRIRVNIHDGLIQVTANDESRCLSGWVLVDAVGNMACDDGVFTLV